MISSASVIAALLVASGARASDSVAASSAVAAAVAARWQVPAELVALAWGREGAPDGVPADVRLVGAARDGWFTVVCSTDDGNSTYRRVRAGVRTTHPVAARDLARGVTLAADDLAQEPEVRWGPPVVAVAPVAAGWEVMRPIARGEALGGTSVRPPRVIHAGEPVTLEYRKGSLRIEVAGTALVDARAGQPVRVKVEGRRDRIAAIAVGPGRARLDREMDS